MSDKVVGPVGSSFQDGFEEISNNNSLAGDANANAVQDRDGRTLEGFMSHTEEHEKITIWGTDSQCDDPELAEFEMLEYQELEAYLVESEENYAIPGTMSYGVSQTRGEVPKEIEDSRANVKEEETHKPIIRTAETGPARSELSSDNDVFVSCYSTVSSLGRSLALDNTGRTQTTEYWPAQTEPSRTLSDITLPSQSCLTLSDRSRNSLHVDGTPFDLSLNTITFSEEPLSEAQESQPAQSTVTYQETSGQLGNGRNECYPSVEDAKTKHNKIRKASEDNVVLGSSALECQGVIREEWKHPGEEAVLASNKFCQQFVSKDTECFLTNSSFPDDPSHELKHKPTQSDETPDKALKPGTVRLPGQCVLADPVLSQKQASFGRTRSASPTSLDRRKPWGSPSRSATPPSHKPTSSPRRQLPTSPAKTVSTRHSPQEPARSPQSARRLKPPSKSYLSSGIPKFIPAQHSSQIDPESKKVSPAQKYKNVRPKIITSVCKSPRVKPPSAQGLYETSTLPSKLTAHPSTPASKETRAAGPRGSPVLSSSRVLYDKYHQELQKAGYYSPPGLAVSGVRRPSHTVPQKLLGKSESFHGEFPDRHLKEVGRTALLSTPERAGVCRSPRALMPQLGLGTRQSATKSRMLMSGQRPASPLNHMSPPHQDSSCYLDPPAGDQRRCLLEVPPWSLLPKPGRSGLQPPLFSQLPAAHLASFGFIRSASVSSVSSSQSTDSTQSDLFRPASLPSSSSKRCAVVSPKPQFPVRQKSCLARVGSQAEVMDSERERLTEERLTEERLTERLTAERCVEQDLQLASLQAQLHTATICMDALAVTTQHFYSLSEKGALKEKELSLELCRIRDEVAVAVGRWQCLRNEKEELEWLFQEQLKELRVQNQKDLQTLQERLKQEQQEEADLLQKQQYHQLEQLYSQHHRKVEEMTQSHDGALQEMEATHSATLVTLQEEHARTIKNLKMAHEQEKKSLEEEFEKLRLSLQDQVDTLTFQSHSLRDRAKRFEEALRRSTDEQIVDALAPYQHIEEDLKSLKEVLEMKNQQIHEQQLKISELERMAQKNVHLEDRVQVLQQQNEDLKARIDMNLAMSRHLTEENANLQEYVEKESNEKKRLSRTNEELLWRLQTGELSPRMSPNQSPLHRPPVDPVSPTRLPPCPP